ncbi:HIG1 domain member 2A [Saitoella coloradoensis]
MPTTPASQPPLPPPMEIPTLEDLALAHKDPETSLQKVIRKSKQQPLVPLGVFVTCFALIGATRGIRNNNKSLTNFMFRLRVGAQGFTIVAMLLGTLYYKDSNYERYMKHGEEGAEGAGKAPVKTKEDMEREKRALWFLALEEEEKRLKRQQQLEEVKRKAQDAFEKEKKDAAAA